MGIFLASLLLYAIGFVAGCFVMRGLYLLRPAAYHRHNEYCKDEWQRLETYNVTVKVWNCQVTYLHGYDGKVFVLEYKRPPQFLFHSPLAGKSKVKE